jgi:hypothetical protein
MFDLVVRHGTDLDEKAGGARKKAEPQKQDKDPDRQASGGARSADMPNPALAFEAQIALERRSAAGCRIRRQNK